MAPNQIMLRAFLVLVLGYLLAAAGTVLAQDRTQEILLVPFAITEVANPECGRLDLSAIPQNLATRLNRSRVIDVNVTRLFEDSQTQSLADSVGRLEGFLSDRQLQTLLAALRDSDYSLVLLGQIKVIGTRKNIISVECQVVDVPTGKIEFFINSHKLCESRFDEALVRELQNQFEINLTQKIRIGLLNFKMTYCDDSTRCPALQEAIPTMLGTGLSISEAITLVEMKEIDQLLALLTGTSKAREGIYDRNTALEIGHMINVNYLIMGEYWFHNNKVRIDSRCVNIETGEIILSKGINIDNFDVKVVTERINSLATEIRTTIEEDLLAIRKTAKADERPASPQITLSVVCFPPYPQDRSNKLRASQIRKTISSKLRLVEALSIKDDVKKIERYLNQSKDRLQITAELNVNHLISLEFENYNDLQYLLSADAYDVNNPTRTYFKDIQKASSLDADAMLNAIVFNYLKSLHLLTDSLKTEIAGIVLPTWLERFSLGVKGGSIRRKDQQVFLNDGIGEYGEVFLNYNLINKLKFEFIMGYDTGKRKDINASTRATIYSVQPGFAVKYNFRESKTINPYAGTGLSALLVPRALKTSTRTDEAGDIKAGLMAFAGVEFALQGLPISFYLEPRYLIGLPVRAEAAGNEFSFKKGWLGGLYILGGIGYNFNY